ncbi:MAG: hypothetical protein KKB03_02990 [Nanoarchaeota archaeon]|nr:hypothetical protein [Nanoarchaeota archaeon]MBU1135023.1 hypothetical protein [Nanoarchaeota archaeon]MBU2520181.1 hypothetical protein [Nanoarchaeota archaeon]
MDKKSIKSIVTFDELVDKFPRIKQKSKNLAEKLLPLYPSPELAQIVAALMTDGHIDWYTSDGRPRTRKIILYSSNKDECDWFIKTCKDLFGLEGKTIPYKPKYGQYKLQPYKAVINSAVIARILILAGVPAGDKTKIGYIVPEWVISGDNKIKKSFLMTLFTFDGCKPYKRRTTWTIEYSTVTSQKTLNRTLLFFKQLKQLLKEFQIYMNHIPTEHLRNNKKIMVISSISSRESIVNFYRFLGYDNPEKQKRLEEAVKYISDIVRLENKDTSKILEKFKNIHGTDKKTIYFINKTLNTNYTYRQFEHFRRCEIEVPLKLFVLASKNIDMKPKLLEWMDFLVKKFNVPSSQK